MFGERAMSWLDSLKIAIVEQDIKLLDSLLNSMPLISSRDELDSAIVLIDEAIIMVNTLRDDTLLLMNQLKKNLDFLRVNDIPTSKRLDVTF